MIVFRVLLRFVGLAALLFLGMVLTITAHEMGWLSETGAAAIRGGWLIIAVMTCFPSAPVPGR
jgi:hypothetical protein